MILGLWVRRCLGPREEEAQSLGDGFGLNMWVWSQQRPSDAFVPSVVLLVAEGGEVAPVPHLGDCRGLGWGRGWGRKRRLVRRALLSPPRRRHKKSVLSIVWHPSLPHRTPGPALDSIHRRSPGCHLEGESERQEETHIYELPEGVSDEVTQQASMRMQVRSLALLSG